MLGYHIIKEEKTTYEESLDIAISKEVPTGQIFVAGPHSMKLLQIEVEEYKQKLEDSDTILFAHNAYVCSPWNGSKKSIDFIKTQLDRCHELGLFGLVVHLPKNDIKSVMDTLQTIQHDNTMIYLEIPSVKPDPNKSWETPERINLLCREIRKLKLQHKFKICVDTAHLFASGYDISTKEQAEEWLSSIKYPKMIGLIHLNESAVKLGNGRDVHAEIGHGLIWGDLKDKNKVKKSGLLPFLNFAIKHEVPMILERGGIGTSHIDRELDLVNYWIRKLNKGKN